MALSKFSIFLLTLIVYLLLLIVVKRTREHQEKVLVYSIGQAEFESSKNDHHYVMQGLLHIEQVVQKVDGSGNLSVVRFNLPDMYVKEAVADVSINLFRLK